MAASAIAIIIVSAALRGIPPDGIAVLVAEPAGIARESAPVTGGIPFPPRAVRPDAAFALLEGDREIPFQATPLSVDREGFLRWLLLDFELSLGAGETKTLALVPRAKGRAERREGETPGALRAGCERGAISVAEDEDRVLVSTGPLAFEVGKAERFGVLRRASVRGKRAILGGSAALVDAKSGARYAAGVPTRIAFEYRGPIRATLRVDGFYEPEAASEEDAPAEGGAAPDRSLRYIARITAWAGSAALRIEHILANSDEERVTHRAIGKASIRLFHALEGPLETRAGAEDGWIAIRSAAGSILACDRDFEGDPPRRLAADSKSLAFEYVSEPIWLYDLSHRSSDLLLDLDASGDPETGARAFRSRLVAFARPEWYSACDVLAVGRFGTLEDEEAAYRAWGWAFEDRQIPRMPHQPRAFVRWEDNHYESEADSPEALLLMALRTGERGFFDLGEAWARYHANLHAWRTDGWTYDDGAIWFPQGGPLGTKPRRAPAAVKYKAWGEGTADDRELWHLVQGKACYCHFYGAGLVDHFLLTGSRDSLEAALDLVEQKRSEFLKHRELAPGRSTIDDTRGFGRGFYVIVRVLEVLPENAMAQELARLCRDVLWSAPNLDERGFAPSHIGTGFGGFDPKRDIPPEMRAFMEREGIRMDERGVLADREGRTWPVVCLGGTWQHAYIQAAAYRYAQLTGDEDMADFAEAFGRFAAKFLLSDKCRQTWYYAYMDVPVKGQPWDPWKFEKEHRDTVDGEGCVHEGWYTRFFPDAMAMAYELSGDERLLLRAREFWHYGSKRGYRTKGLAAPWDRVHEFANHRPPKDDTVLSTSRMFRAWAHPRADRKPPEAIRDLEVSPLGAGRALVRFTAPADRGGGRVVRYRLKCAELPIVDYDDYDFARDDGAKRNFWRAANLRGEPAPKAPGSREEFAVEGVPEAAEVYFVAVSLDDAGNRSPLSDPRK